MDHFGDVKMLVLLLACLASSCGRPTGLPNQGYNKNVQQQPSSLDKILKAVLVHESTGNGVHSGSVASDTGDSFKVTKENGYRARQSPSTGYSYSAKTGLQNIRVFHKSHGDTGYTQPQVVREAPRGFTAYGGGTSKVDPDQALKSIHDSLFRPRSGQSFFGSSEGFRNETPKQSGYFYRAPLHAESGFAQSSNNGGPYPSRSPPLNTGYVNENLSNTGSLGYPLIGYQYPSPEQNQKAVFAGENLPTTFADAQSNSAHDLGEVSAFKSSNNAGSGGYSGSSQNGYPFSGFSAAVLSLGETPKGYNGFQHTNQAHSPKPEGFQYEKPVREGYTYEKPAAADQVAISQFVSSLAQLSSENQGYRYEKPTPAQSDVPQGSYTVSDGYQYTAPPQSIVAPQRFEQPSNPGHYFNTPLQKGVAAHQFGQNSNSNYNFNNFAQNFIGNPHSEQPQPYQNEGYHYDQGNKPDSAKSVFKGQPYLPQPLSAAKDISYPTNGYQYDKPDESSRPKTIFKGQPYLPIPPVSGGL